MGAKILASGIGGKNKVIYDESIIIPPAQTLETDIPEVPFLELKEEIEKCVSIETKKKVDGEIMEKLKDVKDKCDVEITFKAKSVRDIVGSDEAYNQMCLRARMLKRGLYYNEKGTSNSGNNQNG